MSCYLYWASGRLSSPSHLWRSIISEKTWTPDYCWSYSFSALVKLFRIVLQQLFLFVFLGKARLHHVPCCWLPICSWNRWFKLLRRFLSYFSLFNKILPGVGLNDSHANFHFVEKFVPTQHGQRHVCRAQKTKIAEPLYIVSYRFSSFLDYQEEFVYGNLSIILVESGEKLGFRLTQELMDLLGRLLN